MLSNHTFAIIQNMFEQEARSKELFFKLEEKIFQILNYRIHYLMKSKKNFKIIKKPRWVQNSRPILGVEIHLH